MSIKRGCQTSDTNLLLRIKPVAPHQTFGSEARSGQRSKVRDRFAYCPNTPFRGVKGRRRFVSKGMSGTEDFCFATVSGQMLICYRFVGLFWPFLSFLSNLSFGKEGKKGKVCCALICHGLLVRQKN